MEDAQHGDLVARWQRSLSEAGLELPPGTSDLFGSLLDEVSTALNGEASDGSAGERVGHALVASGLIDPVVPVASAQILYRLARSNDRPEAMWKLAGLLTDLGRGFQRHLDRTRVPIMSLVEPPPGAEAKLFRIVSDSTAIAIAIGDTEGTLVDVNPGLAAMLGVPIEMLRGISIHHFADPADRDIIEAAVFDGIVAAREGTVRIETRALAPDGGTRWMAFSITYVSGSAGHQDYLFAIGEDVTERHSLQEELHRQARQDSLTGLPNRRMLLERIQAVLDDADPTGRVGLCFADLDRFKHVNDSYGHRVGDEVLREVANRLRDSLPREDLTIARLGGDEFVVLVPPPVDEAIVATLEDCLIGSLEAPIVVDGDSIDVSISVGVVVVDPTGLNPYGLIDAADRQLYRAKHGHT